MPIRARPQQTCTSWRAHAGTNPAPNTPYWYPDRDHVHDVLDGIRRFRRANAAMRKRMADGMGMNKTDMQALQAVIAAQRHGAPLHPRELADELDISTASTTKLLDRLERSGHLTRVPHPADRRSVTIKQQTMLTPKSKTDLPPCTATWKRSSTNSPRRTTSDRHVPALHG